MNDEKLKHIVRNMMEDMEAEKSRLQFIRLSVSIGYLISFLAFFASYFFPLFLLPVMFMSMLVSLVFSYLYSKSALSVLLRTKSNCNLLSSYLDRERYFDEVVLGDDEMSLAIESSEMEGSLPPPPPPPSNRKRTPESGE